MTSTLVRHDPVRDWVEIQERMLVPLYEAVYERLGVGSGTRLLGLDCGSGLALLMAAARGARVAGVEPDAARLAQARSRLGGYGADLAADRPGPGPYDVVTAFHPAACGTRAPGAAPDALTGPPAVRGAAVVLAGWGPPERCASAAVLAEAGAEPAGAWHDDLDARAERAGLRPDGSGRVACPFGYADLDSAVRGLLSTGLLDPAVAATDPARVEKELTEALHPYVRPDGTVWMPNVFRYVIARVP